MNKWEVIEVKREPDPHAPRGFVWIGWIGKGIACTQAAAGVDVAGAIEGAQAECDRRNVGPPPGFVWSDKPAIRCVTLDDGDMWLGLASEGFDSAHDGYKHPDWRWLDFDDTSMRGEATYWRDMYRALSSDYSDALGLLHDSEKELTAARNTITALRCEPAVKETRAVLEARYLKWLNSVNVLGVSIRDAFLAGAGHESK